MIPRVFVVHFPFLFVMQNFRLLLFEPYNELSKCYYFRCMINDATKFPSTKMNIALNHLSTCWYIVETSSCFILISSSSLALSSASIFLLSSRRCIISCNSCWRASNSSLAAYWIKENMFLQLIAWVPAFVLILICNR